MGLQDSDTSDSDHATGAIFDKGWYGSKGYFTNVAVIGIGLDMIAHFTIKRIFT